jgi:hypothetical protein
MSTSSSIYIRVSGPLDPEDKSEKKEEIVVTLDTSRVSVFQDDVCAVFTPAVHTSPFPSINKYSSSKRRR